MHAPGPWTWREASGAGLQISATLPAGFKFDGTYKEADGKTGYMIWTVRDSYTVQIADERWVQFSTGSWEQMQVANAKLIAAAPELLDALQDARKAIASLPEDALGFGGSGPQPNTPDDPGDSVGWPITAELLHFIDTAIAKAT